MKKTLLATAISLAAVASPALAVSLADNGDSSLNLDILSAMATFSTSEDYLGEGGKNWQEGYFKATLNGQTALASGTLYGGVGAIISATGGDGDAAGYTTGSESRSSLDSAMIGWKSADGVFDLSAGKQIFQLGDGFLIAGDALNLGDGLDQAYGVDVNRGGAYYLAARKSFANTAVLRFDPQGPLRADAFWLKSDNHFQQNTRLAGLNLEWVEDQGTLAVSHLKVLGVDAGAGLGLWDQRDGMQVTSLRGQGNAGVENLWLSAELVRESGGDSAVSNDASAWYLEAGWTFADAPWSPTLNGRYAWFSGDDANSTDNEAFDPLFFGFTRGYGTWFQGEVAANYAGPANSGTSVKRLELTLAPSEAWLLGLQGWQFDPVADATDSAGREIDLYGLWTVNEHLIISPLVGLYTPQGNDVKAAQGNSDSNLYAQAVVILMY